MTLPRPVRSACLAALAACLLAPVAPSSAAAADPARPGPFARGSRRHRGERGTPARCNQRSPGKTAIRATVRITSYRGLISGRNGEHEIAFGTLGKISSVFARELVDSQDVQLAMNVASDEDPAGLPQEIPLTQGQEIEVEGEYIPAASAHARGPGGKALAVIHFTHAPCGSVKIGSKTYR